MLLIDFLEFYEFENQSKRINKNKKNIKPRSKSGHLGYAQFEDFTAEIILGGVIMIYYCIFP